MCDHGTYVLSKVHCHPRESETQRLILRNNCPPTKMMQGREDNPETVNRMHRPYFGAEPHSPHTSHGEIRLQDRKTRKVPLICAFVFTQGSSYGCALTSLGRLQISRAWATSSEIDLIAPRCTLDRGPSKISPGVVWINSLRTAFSLHTKVKQTYKQTNKKQMD